MTTGRLTEVDGDEDENQYQLRPYGLMLIRLESGPLAHQACDALAEHMRKFKLSICVGDDGLHFDRGVDDEEFSIINRAIMWRDYTDPEMKAQAATNLEEAVDAARRKTWERRRNGE